MPLSKLKRPPRKPFDVSSDEEDNTPLSELAKEPSQYHLQSQSSHDEDMEKAEEEEGDASDLEEPLDGMVEDGVLPPVSIWFGMVVRLSNALILQVEPGFGGVITATTNGVVGITPRL